MRFDLGPFYERLGRGGSCYNSQLEKSKRSIPKL
jgi:hypothetical protein